MVTTVIVVRHCQSEGNVAGKFQGRVDAPVSEMGEKQLELLSLRFRNQHIDAIYSSPLTRAYKTAQAAGKYHDIPIRTDEGFIEINAGGFEDLTLSEIAEKFPREARLWNEAPDLCEFPNGETMAQVYERVNSALDRIIAENKGKTVLLATHGGVIRNIYARVAYGEPKGIRNSTVLGNTGVSVIEADENGELKFTLLNDLSHIPEEMRSLQQKFHFPVEKGSLI